MVLEEIKTKGMHCPSCEMLVIDALEELNGINEAKASHKTHMVSVEYDKEKINIKKIKDIIRGEGYKVD